MNRGVTRLPDIITQMDHMSKEVDLGSSLILNERLMPQGKKKYTLGPFESQFS